MYFEKFPQFFSNFFDNSFQAYSTISSSFFDYFLRAFSTTYFELFRQSFAKLTPQFTWSLFHNLFWKFLTIYFLIFSTVHFELFRQFISNIVASLRTIYRGGFFLTREVHRTLSFLFWFLKYFALYIFVSFLYVEQPWHVLTKNDDIRVSLALGGSRSALVASAFTFFQRFIIHLRKHLEVALYPIPETEKRARHAISPWAATVLYPNVIYQTVYVYVYEVVYVQEVRLYLWC